MLIYESKPPVPGHLEGLKQQEALFDAMSAAEESAWVAACLSDSHEGLLRELAKMPDRERLYFWQYFGLGILIDVKPGSFVELLQTIPGDDALARIASLSHPESAQWAEMARIARTRRLDALPGSVAAPAALTGQPEDVQSALVEVVKELRALRTSIDRERQNLKQRPRRRGRKR